MKPQNALVVALLRAHPEGVTPADARRWIGCDRLAARVHELKAAGYRIETHRVTVAGSTFARYTLLPPTVAAPIRGRQEAWTA